MLPQKPLSGMGEVLKSAMHQIVARFQRQICGECFRPIRCWDRRTTLGPPPYSRHLACWRRRLLSADYSSYLQAMEEEGQVLEVADHSDSKLAHALQELRILRATASAVHQRVERLEKICQSKGNS